MNMNELIEINTAVKTTQIEAWFSRCEKILHVLVKKIPMSSSEHWKMVYDQQGKPSYIGHSSERIHRIVFLRVWEPLRNMWVDRCLLEPIPEGEGDAYSMVLLARCGNKFLVQAKGEPGNNTPHRVVLVPTVQTSFTNMHMKLSGKIPFAELYNYPSCRKIKSIQDGGQLFNKITNVCVVDLESEIEDLPHNYYWATIEEIRHFVNKGFASEHLMQTCGLLYLGY